MTSLTNPESFQQDLEDRSVRDIVEYSPEPVSDAWCRNILCAILQTLELQYATKMAHRAITPDTIVFRANGEPLLILDDIDAVPAPDAQQAGDLTALARVIHYAITQELAPAGPLAGRVDGYSASLIAAVDACMDPDPAQRPRSVDAVRGLLGLTAAAVPDALPAPSLPVPAATAPVERAIPVAPVRRGRRWAIAAGGGVIAVALALVLFFNLHGAGPDGHGVVTQPQTGEGARPGLPAPAVPAATATARALAGSPASSPAESPAAGASSEGATRSGGGSDQSDGTARVAPNPASATASVPSAASARAAVPPGAVSGHASYQLQIKPWGVVWVDGVDRGVSPPLKRLALTPGPHTIRITHPNYRDSILEFDSAQSTSNGKITVDFNNEAP